MKTFYFDKDYQEYDEMIQAEKKHRRIEWVIERRNADDKIHGYDDGEGIEHVVHEDLQGTANDYF